MSLISENVIPGNHGKTFGTNAKEKSDLERIKDVLMELHGIKYVLINSDVFPIEFTVHTDALVKIDAIEEKVNEVGFHAIPKDFFEL